MKVVLAWVWFGLVWFGLVRARRCGVCLLAFRKDQSLLSGCPLFAVYV